MLSVLNKVEVVLEEGYAGAGDGNAALEGVNGSAALAKVVGDSGKKTILGDDGLGADVVEKEAASTVRVLCLAGVEAALADQGAGLIAQATGDRHTRQRATGNATETFRVRRRDDLGQMHLSSVNTEES